ncbi:MAG: EAL domain-containing protein [Pseudomonadota bacterium]
MRDQSDLQLSYAAQLAGFGYWVWDEKRDRLLRASDEFAAIFGHSSDQIHNQFNDHHTILSQIHPDDRAPYEEAAQNLDYTVEYRIVHSSGEIRYVREVGRCLADERGQPSISFGSLQDISEQKIAQQRLQDHEALLVASTKVANLGYASWNRTQNRFEEVSDEFATLFGVDRKKFLDQYTRLEEFLTLVDPKDRFQFIQSYTDQRDLDNEYSQELRSVNTDGSPRFLRLWTKPVSDDNQRPTRSVVVVQNVSEQKSIELALRESEKRFRDFAESSSDWLWEMDHDLRFTYISERALEVYNISRDAIIGTKRIDIVDSSEDLNSPKWKRHLEVLTARKPFKNFEYSLKPMGQSLLRLRVSGTPILDSSGSFKGYRGTGSDITESYQLSRQLSYQASHDALTGLVNRRELETRLRRVQKSNREALSEHALCYLDLDRFKPINDTCGHIAGDHLLRQLSQLMLTKVRKRDTLARIGGDEFALLMEHCTIEQAERTALELIRTVEEFRFHWNQQTLRIGVSIGLTSITESSSNAIDALSSADAACYAAKQQGRNRLHIYRSDDDYIARHHSQMQWISRINAALDQDSLRLYAQRIESLENSEDGATRFEILLRLQEQDGSLIEAGTFLPAAERYNLSTKLDQWVILRTIQQLKAGPNQAREFMCAVNLSGLSLADEAFLPFVLSQFDEAQELAKSICFEITETAAIANLDSAVRFIDELKKIGCQFALDDFGSGLSSFAYLRNLDVDFLKIDGAFVNGIAEDRIDLAMVNSISDIGQVMGIKTIAEGVERDATYQTLKTTNIDYVQGYFVAHPEPLSKLLWPVSSRS